MKPNKPNGLFSQFCERAWTWAKLHVQAFVPSPSAAPLCLPKWIILHLYKVKSALCGDYVRPSVRPSVRDLVPRPYRLWDFHEIHLANSSHKVVKQQFRENSISDTDTWLNEVNELLPPLSVLLCRSGWNWMQTIFTSWLWRVGENFMKTGAVKTAFFLTK